MGVTGRYRDKELSYIPTDELKHSELERSDSINIVNAMQKVRSVYIHVCYRGIWRWRLITKPRLAERNGFTCFLCVNAKTQVRSLKHADKKE